MCISNKDLKRGRGNGTICKFVSVKLKHGQGGVRWKNWDGRKVNTVSIDDIECMQFQHWPKPPENVSPFFKLTPEDFSSVVQLSLTDFCDDVKLASGNVNITQIPVNSNVATTGHKLQGMSKDVLIVNSWNYGFANWIYVVLSRVRTLSGLYLCHPLDLSRPFQVPEKSLQFESRMRERERIFLEMRNRE